MYASLTLFTKRLTSPRTYLLTTAAIVLALTMISCGAEEGDSGEVAKWPQRPHLSRPQLWRLRLLRPRRLCRPRLKRRPPRSRQPQLRPRIGPSRSARNGHGAVSPANTRTDYELKNTQEWLNGEPTTIAEIRDSGRVVLVDFWTYT